MTPDIRVLAADASERAAFDWGHLTWFAGRSLGNSEDQTVGRCVLSPGASNPRHRHPNCSEVIVVIHGRIRHTAAGGGTVEMGDGDTVTIPPDVWHHATNIGPDEAVLFITFSSAVRRSSVISIGSTAHWSWRAD